MEEVDSIMGDKYSTECLDKTILLFDNIKWRKQMEKFLKWEGWKEDRVQQKYIPEIHPTSYDIS